MPHQTKPEHQPCVPCPVLTQTSPDKSKKQREQDVAPVPLMLRCYGDNAQEEEDEGLGDGAKHLDHMADGCAGSLGNIFLHVVLHGQGTGHDAAEKHKAQLCFCCMKLPFKRLNPKRCLKSTHAMIDEMAKSSATR